MLLIDGVLWGNENSTQGKMPFGGVLSIGKTVTKDGLVYDLVGKISRVNLWSKAKKGGEIEAMAKSPDSQDGDLISWFMVKDYISNSTRIITPSNASFSG